MPVRLQLFGGIRAFDADRELSWVPGQPVRSALLLYLSIEHEATRDQLARIFWPNEEIERARHSLSQTLYLLRRALGDGFIQQQGEVVRLPTPPETDAAGFEAAVEAGELDRAAALYRGTFLKDVRLVESRDFEEWVDRQRARLERLHRRLRRAQVDQRVTAGDVPGAIEVARAWVTVEPFEDEAQHRLIELLSLAGRRQEALAQYDSYEHLLRADELEPLDETKALVAELRAGRATAGDRPAIEALAVPPWPGSPAPNTTEAGLPAARPQRRRPVAAVLLVAGVMLLTGATTAWLLHRRADNAGRQTATSHRLVSIAVLPCTNLSGDSAQGYFADGIAEELRQNLSAVAGLDVRASQSSFAFKGRREDVQAIAARLRVDHLVECSLRRSGTRVRAVVQLVNGSSGRIERSDRYDLDAADVLAMQDQIARSTVSTLKGQLLPDSARPLLTGGTSNPDARDAYYRGLAAAAFRAPEPVAVAQKHFELATRLDPAFARAWSGLAWVKVEQQSELGIPPAERTRLRSDAEGFAHQALRLASTLAEPHVTLARVARSRGDPTTARREVDEALRLDPSSREAIYSSGMLFLNEGDRVRARAAAERLVLVDPVSPTAHYEAATIMNHIGEYARADSLAATGLRLDSLGFAPAPKWAPFWNRGYANLLMRRYEKAAEYFPRNYEMTGKPKMAQATAVVLDTMAALTRDGSLSPADRERALAVLRQNDRRMQDQVAAVVYLLLDDKPGMYAFMASGNFPTLFWPTAAYDAVRNEPKFQQLMAAARKPK